jgi:peptide/nickel transport system permease protein
LGLGILLLAIVISIGGGYFRPDASKDANNQRIAIAGKPPNFTVDILRVYKNSEINEGSFLGALFFGGKEISYNEIPLHSYEIVGDSIVGYEYSGIDGVGGNQFSYHLCDVLAGVEPGSSFRVGEELVATSIDGSEFRISYAQALKTIKEDHLQQERFALGTDKFGRDFLSRIMAGTIISLSVGLISVLISLLLGISLGAIAGYFGGLIDDLITWLINVVWSIPTLLLVIAITFALGKGFVQVFVAVGLTMWVEVARIVRGQVISAKNMEYVEAAKALGYGNFRIIVKHILPNVMGPVIVISAANFASAILLEAGLSFLGIGAQIPMASWGGMIKDHYAFITTDLAYLAVFPGLCILILVLAFMLVGSALRDSFDTRMPA